MNIQGSIVALITPFLENEELDLESFKRIIHFQIEQGTKGLVVGGTTGESACLSNVELEILTRVAVQETQGRIPIFVGVGTNSTKATIEKAMLAKKSGADGCLAVFPYYNKPGFEGCLAHFQALSSCHFPTIIYYHPGRTGVTLSILELAEICSLPNVIGIKDCSGNALQMFEVQNLCKKALFSGDDGLLLPFMEGGAQGMISVIGNLFPHKWSEVINYGLVGDMEKARSSFVVLEPLIKALALSVNPQSIKYAMSFMGHCKPILRLPLVLPKKETRMAIEEEILILSKAAV